MNASDVGADTTTYEACAFGPGTAGGAGTGLLALNAGSVNHHLRACAASGLATGMWFQQGGNVLWDGCKAESIGTVLKIGTGASALGGGTNASTFLLRNVRTNPLGGTNVIVADTEFASPGTQVTIDGWNDASPNTTDTSPAVRLGAGASVNLRHSQVARPTLASEGTTNPPTATTPATLRLENLIVPEGNIAAAMASALTAKTKVDVVTERTSQYNVVRPDVNTIAGRARYAPVTWLIQQLKPKFFYDLGDVGMVAPNQGTKLYLSGSSVARSDGQYFGAVTQNAQGIVGSDSVGGYNARGPAGTPTGWVTLLNGGMNIGPVTGTDWTLFVIVRRNADAPMPGSGVQWIFTNVAASSPSGGTALYIDDGNSSKITFYTYSMTTKNTVVTSSTGYTGAGTVIYIMVTITAAGAVNLYTQGSSTSQGSATYGGSSDSTTAPLIGVPQGTPSPIADLGIARFATFDSLVSTTAFHNIYQTGTTFQGR